MGFTPTEHIWFNGKLVPWNDAKVHVLAHGLHYGTGVFEGLRSYPTADGPAVFRLDAHSRSEAVDRARALGLLGGSTQITQFA